MNRLATLILPRAWGTIEARSHELPVQSGKSASGRLHLHSSFTPHGIVRLVRTRPPAKKHVARLGVMATGMLPYAT